MSFKQNWIDLIHAAAKGTRKTRTVLTPLGVLAFLTFTAFFVVLAILVDRLLNLPGMLPEAARFFVGIPVIVVGSGIALWSGYHFLKVKGTPVPFNPPPELVATGPYRYVRNPMLTGIFVLLLGIGFLIDSMSLVLFFTPMYVLANAWELRNIEEPELVKRLGDPYVAYRNRTPMFLPGSRLKSKSAKTEDQ